MVLSPPNSQKSPPKMKKSPPNYDIVPTNCTKVTTKNDFPFSSTGLERDPSRCMPPRSRRYPPKGVHAGRSRKSKEELNTDGQRDKRESTTLQRGKFHPKNGIRVNFGCCVTTKTERNAQSPVPWCHHQKFVFFVSPPNARSPPKPGHFFV